ncbi:MAG: anhydro-N-acetylmuramic acid kinase [Chitinivibrionales bacterium]|nr:anhydro-N-acetylmuramic acid kinase [Chitinivibrionales bacterium]
MDPLKRLIKARKKNLIVLSAGSLQSGICGLCLLHASDSWEIAESVYIPYPAPLQKLLAQWFTVPPTMPSISEYLWLDYKCSRLMVETALALLARLPKFLRQPHALVLNKCMLYKESFPEGNGEAAWNWEIGDEQALLRACKAPVFSGFLRADILSGGGGALPTAAGDVEIARRIGGTVAFVNIGLFAHLTIVDGAAGRLIADTDCGPGTCCINSAAEVAGLEPGFDRDGSLAASGTVLAERLAVLGEHPWFASEAPRSFSLAVAQELSSHPALDNCAPADRVATITALTGRAIFDCFKRLYKSEAPPKAIVISGGGAHNATLLNYLKTYFDPLPVQTTDAYGIGVDQRTALALGLSVAIALKKGISEVPGMVVLP